MVHFVNLKSFNSSYLEKIVGRSLIVKSNPERFKKSLAGKKMYMLFEKTSTRTALSFSLGIQELGGMYFMQSRQESNFSLSEIRDEVRYVGRNVDVIMARLKANEDINQMAEYSTVPVINGCCDRYHPCQAMADMLTIRELSGGFHVKMLYIGIRNNVFNSLLASLPKLGGELFTLTPITNYPEADGTSAKKELESSGHHEISHEGLTKAALREIIGNMDFVYTDTWIDMEHFHDEAYNGEKNRRLKVMTPFQLNRDLLEGHNVRVMHDMPMHPGLEITRDIIEEHLGTILRQAENRRHAQKAILLTLLEDENIKALFS